MPLIVTLCLGWSAGIWLAAQTPLPLWGGLMGAGLALLLAWRWPSARWWWWALAAAGLGAARYQWAQPVFDNTFVATYNDQSQNPVTLEGIVWDDPDVRDMRTNLRVAVDTLVRYDGEQVVTLTVRGLALVYAPRFSTERLDSTGDAEWRYGDRVRVSGQLETPPEFTDFSYKDYLARQGVYSQVRLARVSFLAAQQGAWGWQVLLDFKRRALQVLAQIFPEPHAALLSGILLGVDAGIPQNIKDAFSVTGTSHIVAISG